jgi:lipopolysaccharide cholinephosphotransferase
MDKSEVKIYLLYLLKKLYEITEANHIPIYASGGTCLGMVRHKGMIPWDDDIDLMIFRKDYERFTKLCEQNLEKPIALRTRENDPYFCQEFAKLCFIDDEGNYTDLSIDIFELDDINPDRKKFCAFQNFVKSATYFIKLYKVSRLGYEKFYPKTLFKKMVLHAASILPLEMLDRIQRWAMTLEKNETNYVVNWGAAYVYTKATYPKAAFGNPQKMPFENTYVWAEEHPEIILEQLYGKNYMTPPSPEKRTDHGVRKFVCSRLNFDTVKKEVGML